MREFSAVWGCAKVTFAMSFAWSRHDVCFLQRKYKISNAIKVGPIYFGQSLDMASPWAQMSRNNQSVFFFNIFNPVSCKGISFTQYLSVGTISLSRKKQFRPWNGIFSRHAQSSVTIYKRSSSNNFFSSNLCSWNYRKKIYWPFRGIYSLGAGHI